MKKISINATPADRTVQEWAFYNVNKNWDTNAKNFAKRNNYSGVIFANGSYRLYFLDNNNKLKQKTWESVSFKNI